MQRRKMNKGLLESPQRDASNGSIFMFLAFIDEKLSAFYYLEILIDYSSNIEARDMKIPPFDVSRHGDSDNLCFMFLRFLDEELMQLNFQKK